MGQRIIAKQRDNVGQDAIDWDPPAMLPVLKGPRVYTQPSRSLLPVQAQIETPLQNVVANMIESRRITLDRARRT